MPTLESRDVKTRVALLLLVLTLAGRADAQGILDFVTFDGVDYIRWAEEPGRVCGKLSADATAWRPQLLPRPHRLVVRTPPFQGGNTGSNPVGDTI